MRIKKLLILLLAFITCFTSLAVLSGCNDNKIFTITFDANGGTLVGESTMQVTYGKKIGEMPTATKDGLNFIGWYLTEGSTETKIKSDRTYTWKKNITLKAQWGVGYRVAINLRIHPDSTSNTWTAVYDVDPNTDGNQTTFTALDGEFIKDYLKGKPTFAHEDYYFKYWRYKKADGTYAKLDLDIDKFSSEIFGDNYDITIYAYFGELWLGPY